jgi:cardiolipin synthase
MLASIFILFELLGILTSLHAVLQTRTSQGAVAWVVCLLALPVVAVPAYWVFGRNRFNGYVVAWRDASLNINEEIKNVRQRFHPYQVKSDSVFPEYEAIKKLSNFQFTRGNDVELLIDGEATFDSMSAGIEAAKSYILFQFYIICTDDTGNRFKEQLVRKAAEGVAVYVLYDELGSNRLNLKRIAGWSESSIQIIPFNTRKGFQNRFQLNFRNHRKILVVDGISAWVGGLNIGDDYLGKNRKLTPWRDTHLRIVGPASLIAQTLFFSDWHWASSELLSGLSWEPKPKSWPVGEATHTLILGSGPADEFETASLFFTNLMNMAKKRIWIATPYFIPDEATMVALRLALLRGIEVRILTPDLNDNWFVRQASNVYLSDLSCMGAEIYLYQNGFMHQKVMLVDDRFSLVGTVNFDNRSFRLNFEVTAVVSNRQFATEVKSMLEDDFSVSTQLTDYRLGELSLWERLKAHGSALLAPVL